MQRLLSLIPVLLLSTALMAQTPSAKPVQPNSATPATKIEAFQPAAGTVVTLGYDDFATLNSTVRFDAREIRDADGNVVHGIHVDVQWLGQPQIGTAFVDVDEIPELIKGIDAILDVKANPTKFANFEVSYKTKGGLEVTAYNGYKGAIQYAIEAGRIPHVRRDGINPGDMQAVRQAVQKAYEKVRSVTN